MESYWQDLQEGKAQGRNLVMEKYAYMMESTAPKKNTKRLPRDFRRFQKKNRLWLSRLWRFRLDGERSLLEKYPHLSGQARIIHTSEDTLYDISFETYLRGELKTYSMQTLVLYGRRIVAFVQEPKKYDRRNHALYNGILWI